MDYHVGTETDICLWITYARADKSGAWRLHGIEFPSVINSEDESWDGYSGEVSLVTSESQSVHHVEMDVYHSFSRGFGWLVEVDSLPFPPFLLTSRIDTYLIFDGLIELKLSEYADEVLNGSGGKHSCAIVGENDWFGVLVYRGPHDIQLSAFSTGEKTNINIEGSKIFWAEHSSSCIGQINRVQNRVKTISTGTL